MIFLKNIQLPRLPPIDPNIDLAYLQEEGEHWLKKRQVGIETLTKNLSHDDLENQDRDGGNFEHLQPKIQSTTTQQISEMSHYLCSCFENRFIIGSEPCHTTYLEEIY